MSPQIKSITEYHEETKHHFHRYARSLGYMDWDSQPNPFRIYEGAPLHKLPLGTPDPKGKLQELFDNSKNPQTFDSNSIAKLLELSLGLSAWKEYGPSKWALRMNPSSGNLHPTESYWIVPQSELYPSGLFHYNPLFHALEERRVVPTISSNTPYIIGCLSSIFWRESWKYGERAFRYCNHDIGHALAALSFAANLLGWQLSVLPLNRKDAEELFGFTQTKWPTSEEEHLDLVFTIHAQGSQPPEPKDLLPLITEEQELQGVPNQLSSHHEEWPIIEEATKLLRSEVLPYKPHPIPSQKLLPLPKSQHSATEIIRKRRSAQAFHPQKSSMCMDTFYAILTTLLPHEGAPFSLGLNNRTDILLFVHRVEDLSPGLYMLVRDDERLKDLKASFRSSYRWEAVSEPLPLYLLQEGNQQAMATRLSCQQDIAGDSTFSLAMITDFAASIETDENNYPQLFWEAGALGQILYLMAEAYEYRGTGIGCYFDDPVQSLLGLSDNRFQSTYHFTVGFPYVDNRLQTLSPYHHLE